MSVELFLTAVGLALVIEGLFPALFPNKWRNYVLQLAQETPQNIRSIGLMVVVIGIIILWLQS